ncbi:efflux RND transporter permease subunit [Histidinibacterium aquaticum]|uniref:Efflux RND transporter permease subunit n=1 Tax=Histidinibacterium aquaticum TaxID=2613962 RepID=A0A5J5GNZ2_9RHOB|nr:efflux RND transporter permease subunit [Histidinibacterium aquaticum]KAA9009288.1 efflux RND transporter permease subunit [Histidinibacterium aquaticum]
MTGIVDWAASRARMILAFIAVSLLAGGYAYVGLPKEGEPDIEIPALFISVPFPGISAEDSETLLVRPMETELSDLDGLKTMSSTAAEGYAGVALEFEFGWDKTAIMADVREAMSNAEASFPAGADQYSINEINFSEFPIVIVSLTGDVPERTLLRAAKDLQDRIEGLDAVLEAGIAGQRDEMVEVVIDPLKLEAYNVTAGELINVVTNNNLLVAAGEVETASGAFSVKIPSSFDEPSDIYDLPVKTNGDRVITLGDLATIHLTFEDRAGTARFNGTNTVALQVVKRKGFNLIDTVDLVKETIAAEEATWPDPLRTAITVSTSNDQSRYVASMVSQLEGSVLTAVALVMIVVLAALGPRPALLVGFAIPTSFLLCFVLLGTLGITISNIVMFGLILAVGMLVDGAIVVVEYADKRISEGSGPMSAYTEAAKRMFWPIVSSTATTLCAFLPMLFWPGVAGEFMGMLPTTLIFVLSASLIVALIYLPVMGGVTGRLTRNFERTAGLLKRTLPWVVRAALVPVAMFAVFAGAMLMLNPGYFTGAARQTTGLMDSLPGILLFLAGAAATSITLSAAKIQRREKPIRAGYRRSPFGYFIAAIANNPIMPLVTIGAVIAFVVFTFSYYGANNNGTEFFVESEPEQGTVYVRARGNLSLAEKDELVRQAEEIVMAHPGVTNVFSFAGDGGLNTDASGSSVPGDTVGQVQFETIPWEDRADRPDLDGDVIIDELNKDLEEIPGIQAEILALAQGPGSGKPVHLRLMGDDWEDLREATAIARERFEETTGLTQIEDTLPLPGIDWQINVDVEKAGRFGADVATVGAMVQLVTNGVMLDTMRVDSSDEEIEIRVRLPEEDRVLSTLDTLRVRTSNGLVPLSNFVTREPVAKLAQIDRVDQTRHFDVKADVAAGLVRVVVDDADLIEAPAAMDAGTGQTLAFARLLSSDVREQQGGGAVLESPSGDRLQIMSLENGTTTEELRARVEEGTARTVPVNPTERIADLTSWLETSPLPASVDWEWTGDQEEQQESMQFLGTAFGGALALMFIILLAQFNSFYNSVLVLVAVVLSTSGVLWGMLLMDQTFSVIMTGTGIVALAGIVVNNNIVLIDTYQEYESYMPRTEAIIRTAEDRIRPVLLTTITTMAGLAPMMFGLSLDFVQGGYTIDSPTALWWKQLATAVVFGLGLATVLTLVVTPSLLAVRVWTVSYVRWLGRAFARISFGRGSRWARDWALATEARRIRHPEIVWDDESLGVPRRDPVLPLRAAE